MNAKAKALAREFAGLPAVEPTAPTVDTDPIKAIAAVLDQLPDDSARVAYLERCAIDALKRDAIEAKAICRWLNRMKSTLAASSPVADARPIVTDGKGRTLVLDSRMVRGHLHPDKTVEAEIDSAVAALPDDAERIAYLERRGRAARDSGGHEATAEALACWRLSDRIRKGK